MNFLEALAKKEVAERDPKLMGLLVRTERNTDEEGQREDAEAEEKQAPRGLPFRGRFARRKIN